MSTASQPWHDVRVHWPDGRTHLDGIRGHDQEHAVDRGEWNWPGCARVEYLAPADDQRDASCSSF